MTIRRFPLDPSLAAEIQAERDALLPRFLDVGWEVGPDGRAQALRVTGQLPVYDDVEAVFSQDDVGEGDAYAVTGLTSTAAPDQLRAAGDDYPAWVTDRYLELPETVTDRTRELASQLATGQPSAFDAAVAVEEYVRSTIAYNEDIDAAAGRSGRRRLRALRKPGGVLRVLRLGDGRAAARRGHPGPGGRRLLPGAVRRERGGAPLSREERAPLGRGLLPRATAGSRSSRPRTGSGSTTVISPRPRRNPHCRHPCQPRPPSSPSRRRLRWRRHRRSSLR